MSLVDKYSDEVKAIFAKYPVKRSAVMPLLYLAQREEGLVTQPREDPPLRDLHGDLDLGLIACVRRARSIYPQRPRIGDEWWWRDPESAQLRSCVDDGAASGENVKPSWYALRFNP